MTHDSLTERHLAWRQAANAQLASHADGCPPGSIPEGRVDCFACFGAVHVLLEIRRGGPASPPNFPNDRVAKESVR